MSKEYPWGNGTPTWTRDVTANDSDKTFTVPTGKIWVLKHVEASLTCSATVGNRLLNVVVGDGTNFICTFPSTVAITASQTGTIKVSDGVAYLSGATALLPRVDTNASPNVSIIHPTTALILPAGYTVRVYDSAAIDAAADDMTVVLHYVEYDA